jgi:2-dehydropantoate 2-reductase
MRYIVYGAGGIGGALGAYLHESGREAVLIARGEHLRRIQEGGLTLVNPEGRRIVRVPAVGHPSEIDFRPGDAVLLTMKTQDTEAALRDLRDAGADGRETLVYCVQNCLANEPMACRYFAQVYGVMIVIPGIHLEPGVVFNPIGGNHGYMDIGRYPRGVDAPAERFVAHVREAGYGANTHADVMASKGRKFLGNLGNALEAVTDGKGDAKPFMEAVRAEAEACLTAAGLPFEDGEGYSTRVRTHRGTNVEIEGVPKRGSSWQSLRRGQGTIETDFLNGEVVMLGRIHGIPTPHNALLQRIANEMARLRQPPGRYTADDLLTLASPSTPDA